MVFVEELQTLTEEREALNDRIEEMHTKRGVPLDVPLVNDGTDEELNKLATDSESLKKREAALFERHPHGGVTS